MSSSFRSVASMVVSRDKSSPVEEGLLPRMQSDFGNAAAISPTQQSIASPPATGARLSNPFSSSNKSDHMMSDDLPEASVNVGGTDSDDSDVDEEEVRRRERDALRQGGHNLSGFAFTARSQTSVPSPLTPQKFTPSTNTGKPRSTKPIPRIQRYFTQPEDVPRSAAQLEKVIHKALITKPAQTTPRIQQVPTEYASNTSPGGPASLNGTLKRSAPGDLCEARRTTSSDGAQTKTRDSSSPVARQASSNAVVGQRTRQGSNAAFLTETEPMEINAQTSREQSTASLSNSPVQQGGRRNMRFSFALTAKLKRKASRRRTIQELETCFDTAELEGTTDDFVDLPPEDEGVNQSSANEDASAAGHDLESSTKSFRKHQRKHQPLHARSLFSTALPEFSDKGELLVSSYPQGVRVDTIIERVIALEPAQLVSRIGPAVEEFLQGEHCKRLLLAFFWHTVVVMRRVKTESELLRAHRAFEHAFYEVNPRSGIHPTIEQAEELLSSGAACSALGATLAFSAVDPNAFSGYFGALSSASSFTAGNDGTRRRDSSDTTGGTSSQRRGSSPVGSGYLVDTRVEGLRAALDDLIVAQGELEDAVAFEEAAFHEMAIHFGTAFRNASSETTSAHELFPFERKEAIFSLFPIIAAHTTFYVLVKTFPNDAHAHIFNRSFRRDILRRFTFWCSGVTLQHVATVNWPTPVEDDPDTSVLTSKDNVVNGQYAVMKEFHKRAHHSTHLFNEWLHAVHETDAIATNGAALDGAAKESSSGVLPPIHGASSSLRVVAPPNPSPRQHVGGAGAATQRHAPSNGRAKRRILPTLQSSASLWYEHGASRGQLTAERTFEYGCSGMVEGGYGAQHNRMEMMHLAGAVFSRVPLPQPDVMGDMHSSTACTKQAQVPATSPFMKYYAQTVLSVDLKVVDLAGREAQPLSFTQLSGLDKFSVHLRFGLLAQSTLTNANRAVDDNQRAVASQARLRQRLTQEDEHFKRVEETKLAYAQRLINYHLSPRNPECIRDAQHCERLLRDALKAPAILTNQSTAQCQQALRSYRAVMFQGSDRRPILHELSIRVACKIRQLQRLRGDIWGANEATMGPRQRHGKSGRGGHQASRGSGIVVDSIDAAGTDFEREVTANEFPLVGEPLDDVTAKIALHQHTQGANAIRLHEETEFSNLMSDFMKLHQQIFTRDRSRYPLMRPSFLPFAVKDVNAHVSIEDRWRAQVIAANPLAVGATKLFQRGTVVSHDAVNKLKGLASFDPVHSQESNLFVQSRKDEDLIHVEQLRQRLKNEFQEQHESLQSELDAFVSVTAIGRRGRLVTPPDAEEGDGLRYQDAVMRLEPAARTSTSLEGLPVPRAMRLCSGEGNEGLQREPVPTPLSPQQILNRVNARTPQTVFSPKPPLGKVKQSKSPLRAPSWEVIAPHAPTSPSAISDHYTHASGASPRASIRKDDGEALDTSGYLSASSLNTSVDLTGRGQLQAPRPPSPRHRVSIMGTQPARGGR